MKAKAMALFGKEQLEMVEREVPRIGPDQALLRIEVSGICGTDIDQYEGIIAAAGHHPLPVVPGHEPVGIIEEIGAEAARRWKVKAGDRVAVQPGLNCGNCEFCLKGDDHYCPSGPMTPWTKVSMYGFIPLGHNSGLYGSYGEYMVLEPRTILHKLPPDIPLEVATMFQPLASGFNWGIDTPETQLGETVMVMGPGQRGLATVVALEAAGASTIIVTGRSRSMHKLELAKRLGATHTIVADQEDTVARVMEITNGRGVDVVVDTVPTDGQTMVHGMKAARMGGRVVAAGFKDPRQQTPFDFNQVMMKGLKVLGVRTQNSEAYFKGVDLLSRHYEKLKEMHTHSFPLEQAEEAILTLAGKRGGKVLGVSINPGG